MSKTLYIRKSNNKLCDCGAWIQSYSIIENKKVKMRICYCCVKLIANVLKVSSLIFLTFDSNPKLPKFLKRI